MKTIINALVGLLFVCLNVTAQDTQIEKITGLKSDKILLDANYSDIKITTWDKDYIELKSKAKSLGKEIGDNYELSVRNESSGVYIDAFVNTEDMEQRVIITDKDGNISYQMFKDFNNINWPKGDGNSANIGYDIDASIELFVPTGMIVKAEALYGDIISNGNFDQIKAYSTYGVIEADLQNVSDMKSVSLASTYDIVDLTIDANSDASLNLSTSYGQVYSDLTMEKMNSSNHYNANHCGSSDSYTLKNGKVRVDVTATYDNIYVRKAK